MEKYDVVIIGSGAAGLAAGMYAARYQLKTVVIGQELGGETTTAWTIENYPGFKSIDGFELVQNMQAQTQANGVTILDGEVTAVARTGECLAVTTPVAATGAYWFIKSTRRPASSTPFRPRQSNINA